MRTAELSPSCTFETPIRWRSRGCGEAETHKCLLYISKFDSLATGCLVFAGLASRRRRGWCQIAAGQRDVLLRLRKAMSLSVYLGHGGQVLSFFSVVRSRWCDEGLCA